MTIRRLATAGLAVISMLVSVPGLFSQADSGRISGTVRDSSMTSVPGASVQAVRTATGQTFETKTNPAGLFVFPNLPAGNYDLSVSAPGFKTTRQSGIVLDVASSRTLEIPLELGELSQQIAVAASAEQVQTESNDVSRLIDEKQISQIALNGRNHLQLLEFIPGSVSMNLNPLSIGLNLTQAFNGVTTSSVYTLLDGAENLDNGGDGLIITSPNIDAISEVRVLTASYAAEHGGRGGAIVNVVTKSGTRDFHGTLFEFVRNDAFDARSFFSAQKPILRFNDYGVTLGGPVYIPGRWNRDKNKLFFFVSEEWHYNHQGQTQISFVPTAAERAGNFSQSRLGLPIDPATGSPFANGVIPASRFSQNGPLLLKPYPLPNYSGSGGNYSVNGASEFDVREDLYRFDYLVSPKMQVSYRWTADTNFIYQPFQGSNTGIVPGTRPRPGVNTELTLTNTLSPTVVNVFEAAFSRNIVKAVAYNSVLKRTALGLTFPELYPSNDLGVGPSLNIDGIEAYNFGDRLNKFNDNFQLRDDFSVVRGSHILKFGSHDVRNHTNENLGAPNQIVDNGQVFFNTSAKNTTRNPLADALLGNFYQYNEDQTVPSSWSLGTDLEFYAQDTWKVNRRLTLNLGLRYSYFFPLYNALGYGAEFLPSLYNPALVPLVNRSDGSLAPGTGDPYNGIAILGSKWPAVAVGRLPQASDASLNRLFRNLPKGGVDVSAKNFAPRIGFAYDPFGRGQTAVRAGFGMFYDRQANNFQDFYVMSPPFAKRSTIYNGNIDNPSGGTQKQFPPLVSTSPTYMPTQQYMNFNFGVQQQLPLAVIMDVSYVGTLGRHIVASGNINQLVPGTLLLPQNSGANVSALAQYQGYSTINMRMYGANSNYNSLQVAVSRRLARSLSFGLNYTFSKTLDTTDGSFQNIYNQKAEYGLANINRKHVLNVNYVYEIPFLRNAKNPLVRTALGGWEISGVTTYQSGAPFSVTVPSDIAAIGVSSSRASVVGNPNLPSDQHTVARFFNTAAFLSAAATPRGQFGNGGRNILTGPSFSQWDVALLKNIRFTERYNLQFRAESFNAINHASFTSINTTVRFDSAGNPTQGFGSINASSPGRVFQFGLKVSF
ncbi:MAG: carboxypeptidase regulatory-like domain-containing protein [Bryobacteraceae bacterium]